jgi:hypothetical protein
MSFTPFGYFPGILAGGESGPNAKPTQGRNRLSASCAAPCLDQALECAPQFRVFQLRQFDRSPSRSWNRSQLRPFATTQATAHETQVAHGVIAHRSSQSSQDLRLHQVEFLNPHRARHLHHRRVEFKPADFRAPRDRVANHLGPYSRQSHDFEMSLGIESRQDFLQRTADLLRGSSSSMHCHTRYDSASISARNRHRTFARFNGPISLNPRSFSCGYNAQVSPKRAVEASNSLISHQ